MTDAGFTLLHCDHGAYIFFPENHNTQLRAGGKFASVYLGVKQGSNQKVVVKKLNPLLSQNIQQVDRFRKEYTGVPEIPGLLKATDYCFHEGSHYLIRPYLEGLDTASHLKRADPGKKQRIRFALSTAAVVLGVLENLHGLGIVHRDIRPQNILVSESGEIFLIDLGLARFPGEREYGKIPFSLLYSPPEQVLNKTEITDPRSDLYSLAITVYELIAGKPPFLHSNPELLMNLQISYPLPESRAIPHPVYEILKKAAAKHRFPLPPSRYSSDEIDNMLEEGKQKRYSSATEMKDAIQKILNQLPEQENFWKKLTG